MFCVGCFEKGYEPENGVMMVMTIHRQYFVLAEKENGRKKEEKRQQCQSFVVIDFKSEHFDGVISCGVHVYDEGRLIITVQN